MIRVLTAGLLGAFLSSAPLQCSRSHDAALAREETAGDALWALAQDFQRRGDTAGANATLRFLAERYPSDRHALAARDLLRDGGAAASP